MTVANVLTIIEAHKCKGPLNFFFFFSEGPGAILLPRIHSYTQLLRTEIQHESFTDSVGGPA